MWTSFCNWWTPNGTYTSIRNIAELFYFIVLTGAMVYYAAKTYKKSVEAKPELIAHVFVDYKERLEHGQKSYPIFLEVYNDGTGTAKNIILSCNNEALSEGLSIFNNNLGFLQPKQSKYIPVGSLSLVCDGIFTTVFNDIVKIKELKDIKFYLECDKVKKKELNIDFAYIMNMPTTPIGKSSAETIDEKSVKQLEAINKSLGNIKSSVDALTKKFK